MCELKRLKVGEFDISDSVTLEELKNSLEDIHSHLITIEGLFQKSDNIVLEDKKLSLFLNGVQLSRKEPDGVYKIYNRHQFIGIGCVKSNLLKRDIIL